MAGLINLVLERDGHDQPWGFRLQGGVDVAMPLSVQRVLVGTPADGTLLKGDIITKISCTETKGITHQQAADLFNNAGNQIAVQLKRAGVQTTPTAATSAAPLVNGSPAPAPSSVPVSGSQPGINTSTAARKENPAVRSLPKTQFVLKSDLPRPQIQPTTNMETLSIQSQPYRTLPLVQPSAKVRSDLGVGSISHLKMQDDHISGLKEPQYVPQSQALTIKAKHDELIMKQKVRRPPEAALWSVEGRAEGEEEATPRGSLGPQAGHFGQGKRKGSLSLTLALRDSTGQNTRSSGKENPSYDFMKINKTTFKVGSEIVQLKKSNKNEIVVNKSVQTSKLRKASAGSLLSVEDYERKETVYRAGRAAAGRSRSLGYTDHTSRLEELSHRHFLTPENTQNLDYYIDPECQNQETEYTVELQVPRVEPTVNLVEVNQTIKLAPPAPPRQESRSVDIAHTVKIKRNYYIY